MVNVIVLFMRYAILADIHGNLVAKYRKQVLNQEVSGYLKEIFQRIAEEYEFRIDTMEVMEDHVHIFVETPPRYSPAQVVQTLESVFAREVFKKFSKLRKQLWAGEFWSDGYFVRSVGDKVTAEIIRGILNIKLMKRLPLNYPCSKNLKIPPSLLGGDSLLNPLGVADIESLHSRTNLLN